MALRQRPGRVGKGKGLGWRGHPAFASPRLSVEQGSLTGPFRKSVNVFMDAASAWLGIVTHRAPPLDDRVPFCATSGRAGSGATLPAP